MHQPFSFSGKRFRGFTLIELLIVVAIIAILAAIAVPNFIEAQVRAKVSRCKADMRSLTTAIESYAVDHNKYPDVPLSAMIPIRLALSYSRACLELLSTPISYITDAKLDDPFAVSNATVQYFGYANPGATTVMDLGTAFAVTGGSGTADLSPPALNRFAEKRILLQSVGPDELNYGLTSFTMGQGFARAYTYLSTPEQGEGYNFLYDPTNGTVSTGDLVRTGAGPLN
jgi:prepilin-type N-terminal cleavage/methylation domain-containing protein